MNILTILNLVKGRLGITSTVRDIYLKAIVDGVIVELKDEKGLTLDEDNPYHIIFIVDYAAWRYQNKDSDKSMPRHLQFRLHNLMIHNGGDTTV